MARALREDPGNTAARSRAIGALLYTTWPLPEADLPHDRPVLWAQFNGAGDRIVTVSDDRTARVWNGTDGSPIGKPLQHEGRVFLARFSAAGRLLTVADDGIARLWDLSAGTLLQTYAHPAAGVTWAAFNPVDDRIVTGASDGTVRFWIGGASSPLKAHAGSLTAASFNRAGDLLLTASADGTAAIWDVRSERLLSRLAGHTDAVVSAQFSPDGRQVATASRDGSARLWDARTGRALLPPLRHNAAVWSVQFSPDGSRLLTASDDGSALVWDTATGRTIGNPIVHGAPVVSAFFSSEGLRIITASRDQTARLWDAVTGAPDRRTDAPRRRRGVGGVQPRRSARRHGIGRWARPAVGHPHRHCAAGHPAADGAAPSFGAVHTRWTPGGGHHRGRRAGTAHLEWHGAGYETDGGGQGRGG